MVRILSIDGGGVRGLIPAMVLADLERRTGCKTHELFDLVVGTSTGGILACGLGMGYSAKQMADLYRQRQADIFKRSPWWTLRTAWGYLGSKYPGDGLRDTLAHYFGYRTPLTESLTKIMTTSYDLQKRRPHFFKSWRVDGSSFLDAAVATASAPTYFPPHQGRYIDGGVFAPDPSGCALAAAHDLWPGQKVVLVSLGTGRHEDPIKTGGWRDGMLAWAPQVADVCLDGDGEATDYEAVRHPAVARAFRLQVTDLPPAARPMDTANTGALTWCATMLIRCSENDLNSIARMTTARPVGIETGT